VQRHGRSSSLTENARNEPPGCESLSRIRSHKCSEGVPIITARKPSPSRSTSIGRVAFKHSSRSQSLLAVLSSCFSKNLSTKGLSFILATSTSTPSPYTNKTFSFPSFLQDKLNETTTTAANAAHIVKSLRDDSRSCMYST